MSRPPAEAALLAASLLCPAGIGAQGAVGGRPGPVPDFRPEAWVGSRKNLKLMARSVQLGVAAVTMALARVPALAAIPPHRRACFTGSNPLAAEVGDLAGALEVSWDGSGAFDLGRFARDGIPRIHPLWLVKGLSNNVLGFASAQHDLQGDNANWAQGPSGGVVALREAVFSVAEGRADLAVAVASDALCGAGSLFPGQALGEGAAAFVVGPRVRGVPVVRTEAAGPPLPSVEPVLGLLGVAGPLVALARAVLSGGLPASVADGGFAASVLPGRGPDAGVGGPLR